MKTTILKSVGLSLLFATSFAQDKTTVNAKSSEISDNLDLRAVASIFGEAKNLDDFEQQINDPKQQISNLDLNNDNQVDYLRVIETVEGNNHIVVLQSVLAKDTFQDVASIEVQRDNNNQVHVQVVGDVYMYGSNYIYEPVYASVPIIYNSFWAPYYTPYYSSWYWGYYPTYYSYWSPMPMFRYRRHIGLYVDHYGNQYNYVNYRRCQTAYNNYYSRRGDGYERQYPNRSFETRNSGYSNRYEMDKTRDTRDVANGTRENYGTRDTTNPRNASGTRETINPRNNTTSANNENPRTTTNPRNVSTQSPRQTELDSPRSQQSNSPTRTYDVPRQTSNNTEIRNTNQPRQNSVNNGSTRGNSQASGTRGNVGGRR